MFETTNQMNILDMFNWKKKPPEWYCPIFVASNSQGHPRTKRPMGPARTARNASPVGRGGRLSRRKSFQATFQASSHLCSWDSIFLEHTEYHHHSEIWSVYFFMIDT